MNYKEALAEIESMADQIICPKDNVFRKIANAMRGCKASDLEIKEWADRHDLRFGGSIFNAREAFEDAQTFHLKLKEGSK